MTAGMLFFGPNLEDLRPSTALVGMLLCHASALKATVLGQVSYVHLTVEMWRGEASYGLLGSVERTNLCEAIMQIGTLSRRTRRWLRSG